MKNFVLAILVMFVSFVNAQEAQSVFKKANEQYQAESYKEAVTSYNSVLEKGFTSSEVYFNLGNAYFKTNQLAKAIYSYEKALFIDPSNKDAQVNLGYANDRIVDRIKTIPMSAFEKFNNTILALFSYNGWAKITVTCSLLAGLLWIFFFFSTQSGVKKMFFTLSVVISTCCFIGLGIAYQQYSRTQNTVNAIVFLEEVSVKEEPRDNALEVFSLHEGTKVKVLDRVGEWHKVKIVDGQVGWLSIKAFKII